MRKRMMKVLALALAMSTLVCACGGAGSSETKEDSDVQVVRVGTTGTMNPYLYQDDKGNFIGYEAEIIQAVDEMLPQYEFEFIVADWESLFLGLDSDKFDMVSMGISWKQERDDKYLFSDEYVCYSYTGAVTRKDDNSIKSVKDFGGKKTYAGNSGFYTTVFLEKYNEQNPDNPIEIMYTEADATKQRQDLINGVIDFLFLESCVYSVQEKEFPEVFSQLKLVELPEEESESIQNPFTWFIYQDNEGGKEIQVAVDEAMRTLKEDGTISGISMKYLGYDTVGYEGFKR